MMVGTVMVEIYELDASVMVRMPAAVWLDRSLEDVLAGVG
jgi:hypothetical protein